MLQQSDPITFKIPPHDVDAERCLLASMVLDPSQVPELRPLLNPESFFQADHSIIFESIVSLHRAGAALDVITLCDDLRRRRLYEEIGGKAYIAQVIGSVPAAAHAPHYAGIVVEKFKLREVLSACMEAERHCYAPAAEDQADSIARRLEDAAARIRETGYRSTIVSLEQVLHEVLDAKQGGGSGRIPFGLEGLDELSGGAPISGYTLVAGAPGMGKSQLCKQVALSVAKSGIPVGIIAAEESRQKIASNYLAGASGVENSKIVFNRLGEEEWNQIYSAAPELMKLPIHIDDAHRKLSEVESTARRMVKKHGCGLIVVDHLHLLDGETEANRTQEITKISCALKSMFKELGVAGVVAAQLNRNVDDRKPPELRNLRDSGSLEADGDLILMLHREDYYRWKDDPQGFRPDHRLRVFVNKNKDGGVGWRDTYFDGDSQTIRHWTDSDEFSANH